MKNGKDKGIHKHAQSLPFDFAIRLERLAEQRHYLLVFSITTLMITVILYGHINATMKKYLVGDIAREDVKSDRQIVISDEETTQKNRDKAFAQIKDYYLYRSKEIKQLDQRIRNYFSNGRTLQNAQRTMVGPIPDFALIKSRFDSIIEFPFEVFDFTYKEKFSRRLELDITRLIDEAMKAMTIIDQEGHEKSLIRGIILRDDLNGKERSIADTDQILDFEQEKNRIVEQALTRLVNVDDTQKDVLGSLLSSVIFPTIQFDKLTTEKIRGDILADIPTVTITLEKEEIIVRKGDKINKRHALIFEQLFRPSGQPLLKWAFGIFILALLIYFFLFTFSAKYFNDFKPRIKDIVVVAVFLVTSALLCRFYLFITISMSPNFPNIPVYVFEYGIPIFATSMLVRLLMNTEISFVFVLANSILFGIINEFSLKHAVYCLVGSLIATNYLKECSQRITILKVGILTGLSNIVCYVILDILLKKTFNPNSFNEYLNALVVVMMSGILSAILALTISPILELFDYVTDIKLLELANSDHPLLSKLAIESPGTHHHSFVVGILAENAAENIGANPLLARVASLYHDIGKIAKSKYFIENQNNITNEHDKLTPRMSSLILVSHVKDGIELARKYKLPKVILDIIPQHHGTNLISYFYTKAKELEDPEVDYVNENDYRYPGPKPQTKEAAIIMLADAIEATSRSLSEPTPARLESVVKTTINKFATDSQFDETDLTLKDLDLIKQSFIKTLTTCIYHHRIEYPAKIVKSFQAALNKRAIK